MRPIIRFFFLALGLSFLVACGGGEDLPGSSGSKESLKAAYFKLQTGMSPEQVKATVGGNPSYTYSHNGKIYSYSYWTGTTGTYDYAILTLIFSSYSGSGNGLSSKSYSGYNGTQLETYSD